MKKKKLLIAGGVAAAGVVLIYLGYKYVIQPQTTTTDTANKPLKPTVSDTIVKGSSPNASVIDKLKTYINNEHAVSGLGNAYLLN